MAVVITLSPELEAVLNEAARIRGVSPEDLALDALRGHFLGRPSSIEPQDDWERGLLEVARDCGTTLSDSVLGSEELYD